MPFLRWFAREGFRTLKYVFRGIFRSLLRYVPCTMHPPLFSHPLRVNGMAGVSLAPMPPGIALKTAAARYAPLRLHLVDRAGLPPCLDLPSGRLTGRLPLAVPEQPDGGDEGIASRRFSCRNAGETGPGPFTCSAGNRNTRDSW